MPGNRLYYHLKPYLPWEFRMALRRVVAQWKRKRYQSIWPINESAAQPPEDWPGWPENKKFAVVLTHDVEGPDGLARCARLMRLEKDLGFCSSFNFIPEGDYAVSRELREELVQNGFEVGVHDLQHDGMLYRSRREFSEKATRINEYLKAWDAKGFRSGFMLHNLEWLHDLDVAYDASTFDTDPFEPQPDGVGTIFPFWVPRPKTKLQISEPNAPAKPGVGPSRTGYVELPYTLVQDSTLFLSLRETSPEIWLRKLDWIAEHGGMALLNVHPDYLRFPGGPPSPRTFPIELYIQFLTYLKDRYAGDYWQPLPREVASWFERDCVAAKTSRSSSFSVSEAAGRPFQGKHAAVLLFAYYEHDPRVRRSTEALSRAGMETEVICLRQEGEAGHGLINGVKVFRVPLKRRRAGKLVYALQYSLFWLASFCILSARSLRRKYQVVHVHNMPDFLVFSTIIPKWRGARIILDLHDPMPELMMTIFGLHENSAAVRFLKWMEKASINFADLVLTVNRSCQEIFTARSSSPEKIRVLMNTPDERIFKFQPEPPVVKQNNGKPFVVMFHGSIVERNGLDLAVAAVQVLRRTVPGAELRICGAATPFLDSVLDSARKAGLDGSVRYLGQKLQKDIVKEIENCDVGVIPNRNNAFTEINTPVRIFEYISLGKPVITPRSRGITDYFMAADLIYFEIGDAQDLARRLEFVFNHPDQVREIVRRGQTVYRAHCWGAERERLLGWVGELLAPRRPV